MLLAAWACANAPQAATFEALRWLGGVAHFSHQAQLRVDVSSILTGAPKPREPRWRESAPPAPAPLLAKLTIKRSDLCVHLELSAAFGLPMDRTAPPVNDLVPDRLPYPPRLLPPRPIRANA